MRLHLHSLAVLVLSSCLAPTAVFADVLCTFTTRSDDERTIGVRGPTFRIRPDGSHQILKVESRGGGSYSLGRVIQVPAQGFTVYLHLPTPDDEVAPMVVMLTIHDGGNASLLIHHGSWGNLSQYRKAWTYQGECLVGP